MLIFERLEVGIGEGVANSDSDLGIGQAINGVNRFRNNWQKVMCALLRV